MATIPPKSARLVFADPPYGIGHDYGPGGHDDRTDDGAYYGMVRRFLEASMPVLTADGSLWLLLNHERAARAELLMVEVGLTIRDWLTWYERFGVNCTRKFNRTSRRLLHGVVDPRRFVFNREAVTRPSARQAVYGDKRAIESQKSNVRSAEALIYSAA